MLFQGQHFINIGSTPTICVASRYFEYNPTSLIKALDLRRETETLCVCVRARESISLKRESWHMVQGNPVAESSDKLKASIFDLPLQSALCCKHRDS